MYLVAATLAWQAKAGRELVRVLRHVGQSASGQRCIEHLEGVVEDELAFDAHLQFSRSFSNPHAYNPPWVGRCRLMQL